MTSRNLPPALEPYLQLPPEASLTLLTSTLACSVNWLTTRFIGNALSKDEGNGQTPIILISWMRDLAFWKQEIKRSTGLDISKLTHFTFVDNFTNPISKLPEAPSEGDQKTILILDNPDILLATGSTTTLALNQSLLRLRSQVHATILICSADQPLVSSEVRKTPIEAETAAFVTTQAHAARLVLSVRELDTGAAKDISGVLRITKGGDFQGMDSMEDDGVKETELLYLVQRDGNAKVFSRGSDAS